MVMESIPQVPVYDYEILDLKFLHEYALNNLTVGWIRSVPEYHETTQYMDHAFGLN